MLYFAVINSLNIATKYLSGGYIEKIYIILIDAGIPVFLFLFTKSIINTGF